MNIPSLGSSDWKKIVIGGTLLASGSFTMFDLLMMNKEVYDSLDEADAAYVGYLTMYGKSYKNIEEYRERKAYFMESMNQI